MKLTIEFELSEDAAVIDGDTLSVDLGSGVFLRTHAPKGLERVNSVVLQIVMDVEGKFSYDQPSQAPVERVHETSVDGGLEERQDRGPGEPGA